MAGTSSAFQMMHRTENVLGGIGLILISGYFASMFLFPSFFILISFPSASFILSNFSPFPFFSFLPFFSFFVASFDFFCKWVVSLIIFSAFLDWLLSDFKRLSLVATTEIFDLSSNSFFLSFLISEHLNISSIYLNLPFSWEVTSSKIGLSSTGLVLILI